MVSVLHDMEPGKNLHLKFLDRHVGGHILHIQHRRQVALLEFHFVEKEIGLFAGRGEIAPEMIGTADDTEFTHVAEILIEILIDIVRALGGFDHDEFQTGAVDHGIAQFRPLNLALMVADVNAVNLISLRIVRVAIQSPPSESKRFDQIGVDYPGIRDGYNDAQHPPHHGWQTPDPVFHPRPQSVRMRPSPMWVLFSFPFFVWHRPKYIIRFRRASSGGT